MSRLGFVSVFVHLLQLTHTEIIKHGLALASVHPNHIHGLMIFQELVCLSVQLLLTIMQTTTQADAKQHAHKVHLLIPQLDDVFKPAH